MQFVGMFQSQRSTLESMRLWPYYGKDKWCWERVTESQVSQVMAVSTPGDDLVPSATFLVGNSSVCVSEWERICVQMCVCGECVYLIWVCLFAVHICGAKLSLGLERNYQAW